MSDLTDKQLQDNITATEMQFNNAKKSNKPEDKIKASKLKKRLDEMIKEQTDRKKGNKGGKSQATASLKSQRVDQKKNNAVPVKKYKRKFKRTDKILVITVDDLDNPKASKIIEFFEKRTSLRVTFFPHFRANTDFLKRVRKLPNAKLGWHGTNRGRLDASPVSGTNKSVIAWSWGEDNEGRKSKLGKNHIARGTIPNGEKRIGEFDQHDLSSIGLGDKRQKGLLKTEADQILANGGVLSVYLHYADDDGLAEKQLEDLVDKFTKAKGGKILHLEELKGNGKGYWKE